MATPSCLRLFRHWERRAASRAACTAGSSSAIRMPMMAMTTSSSTSVKPDDVRRMGMLLGRDEGREAKNCRSVALGAKRDTYGIVKSNLFSPDALTSAVNVVFELYSAGM